MIVPVHYKGQGLGTVRSRTSNSPVGTYDTGRVCLEPFCETVLSVYNRKTKCFVHREPDKLRIRGGKRD